MRLISPTPFTRITPSTGCINLTFELTDNAGLPAPVPNGDAGLPFVVAVADSTGVPRNNAFLRTPLCGGGLLSQPAAISFAPGQSTRTVGLDLNQTSDRLVHITSTPDGGLRPGSEYLLLAPNMLSSSVAVLPMFAVSNSGTMTFRHYLVLDNNSYAGTLPATAAPSTHVIRLSGDRVALTSGLYDARLGTDITPSGWGFGNLPIHGMTRVFSNTLLLFHGNSGHVRVQSILGSGTTGSTRILAASEALAPVPGTGAIAAEFSRNQFNPRGDGTTPVWFVTLGTSLTLVARFEYTYSSFSGTENYTQPQQFSSTAQFQNQTAIGLDQGRIVLFSGNNLAYRPPSMEPYPMNPVFTPTGLPADGPAHLTPARDFQTSTQTLAATVGGRIDMGARFVDFLVYDSSDGGVRLVGSRPADPLLSMGTRAVTNPSLARGCAVNDSFGVTYYYSVRSPTESKYSSLRNLGVERSINTA